MLFANQRKLEAEDLKKYAVDLGLKTDVFNECVDTSKYADAVTGDFEDGNRFGVTGTPAFFVNGRFLSGAKPFSEFKVIIDQELKKS